MGGVPGHVRVLHRDLRVGHHLGDCDGYRFHRLRRCAYGAHIGSIYCKNFTYVV